LFLAENRLQNAAMQIILLPKQPLPCSGTVPAAYLKGVKDEKTFT
jgi:hypothetical protein